MEEQTVFKVCSDDDGVMKSFIPEGADCTTYPLNQWAEGSFPLFAFDNEEDARRFARVHTSARTHVIFEARGINVRKQEKVVIGWYVDDFRNFNAFWVGDTESRVVDAPKGSVVCDKIMLTKRLT